MSTERMTLRANRGVHPTAPLSDQVSPHDVSACAGCDRCQPLDGSKPQDYPCTDTSPSMDGAEVVLAEDYDRLMEAFTALYKAADELHERRWDFPTDMDRGDGYLRAMDDLGNALIAYEPQSPAPGKDES